MKLEVYKESKESDTVRLRLDTTTNGAVVLNAVDPEGKRLDHGALLFIHDGVLQRAYSVPEYLGFNLDNKGRIRIS